MSPEMRPKSFGTFEKRAPEHSGMCDFFRGCLFGVWFYNGFAVAATLLHFVVWIKPPLVVMVLSIKVYR